MIQNSPNTQPVPEQSFFLSELLGTRITISGKKVGKLNDIVIKENGTLPTATHFVVGRPFGETAVVPWEAIGMISTKEISLNIDSITPYTSEPEESAVLLRDTSWTKKRLTWMEMKWRLFMT
jgi:sporulation protein YlmC with PRC-barrel domain